MSIENYPTREEVAERMLASESWVKIKIPEIDFDDNCPTGNLEEEQKIVEDCDTMTQVKCDLPKMKTVSYNRHNVSIKDFNPDPRIPRTRKTQNIVYFDNDEPMYPNRTCTPEEEDDYLDKVEEIYNRWKSGELINITTFMDGEEETIIE